MARRILVVEDEPTLLFALQDYLDLMGYSVDAVSQVEQAHTLLESEPYDLVITDLRLTCADEAEGLQIIEAVRERELPVRVVVLSGCATEGLERAAWDLGIDSFLHKPVPLSVVAGTVSYLIGE